MDTLLKHLSTREELQCHNTLAVTILSHGTTNLIYGSDGKTTEIESFLEYFNDKNDNVCQ